MQDALHGEMVRRQELLRSAGNFANVTDYEKARAKGADLEPLPALLIVADEFSELLAAKPEFVDAVRRHRPSRSLAVDAPAAGLAAPRGGASLRGLESHLSYRMGLRTFSAGESRTVLGVPDAYELPAVPGLGYLKPDQTTLRAVQGRLRLRPADGAVARRRVARSGGDGDDIVPFRAAPVLTRLDDAEPGDAEVVDDGPEPEERRARSTSRSRRCGARAGRPTRCGCRRSTSPTPSTS